MPSVTPPSPEQHERREIRFAHPSEEEFSHILDFYKIEWSYEPRTFPLAWDEGGNVTEALTPDFYLPQQGLYVEITTLRQELVTKKNQKLRRLRELYPDIDIKLFYRRDFGRLLDKYGLSGERGELIGQEALKRPHG
jgi:hypoxanthine phosphoribosyltransferase